MYLLKSILVFILTTQFALADLCDFVYRPNENKLISEDLKHIGKINRLEGLTNTVRKIRTKGGEEFSLMTRRLNEEFKVVEGLLFKGDIDLATKKWRTLFRKVETAALEANNYSLMVRGVNKGIKVNVSDYESFLIKEGLPKYLVKRHIQDLYKVGPQDYLQYLHIELRKHHRKLGNNFEKYRHIRQNLDDLAKSSNCTPLCKQSIKDLQDEIGIASRAERQMHQYIVQSRKQVKLSTVEKTFNSHPEAIVIARRKEFISESVGLLKKYFNNANLMRRLYLYLGNSAAGKNIKLVRMFKRIFDKRFHSVNKGIIDKVTHSGLKPKGQIEMIKAESKFSDYEGILVDMSRSTDNMVKEAWQGLKKYASKRKRGARLFTELNQAEDLGAKIGATSKRLPKDISAIVGTVVVTGAFVGYMTFDTEEEGAEDSPDDGVIILDNDDIDQIQDDDDVIILKYNSELETELREELLEVIDSLTQIEANMSGE